MIGILLISVILTSSEARWFSKEIKGTDLNQLVEKVLTQTNKYVAENKLETVTLPDFFHEGQGYHFTINNGLFGKFSSAQLVTINSLDKTKDTDYYTYSYNLTLGLDPLKVSYDYELDTDEQTSLKGNLQLTTRKDSFVMVGKAEIGEGFCQAELLSSKSYTIEDVSFKTSDTSSKELVQKYIIDFINPHLQNIINSVLDGFSQSPRFRAKYEDVICHVISN